MRTNTTYFLVFAFVMIASSCSTKKNAFLNRNYHAVTTEFNILYNGHLAYDKGIQEINEKYEEDYWNLIPIEPIKFEDKDIAVPNFGRGGGPGSSFKRNSNQNSQATTFERAEEKATKAIQRHSMSIYGIERNPQIDDAYFLLGRSRYYTQRFIPAIEAFNYIISKYPKASLIDETKIWRAKTNVRIENEDVAIDNLLKLLKKEKLDDDIKEKANTALAMAYQKKDSTKAVIHRLYESAKTDKNPIQKSRNLFIIGQIYAQNKKIDSAFQTFERLSNYNKAPYRLKLEANMALSNIAEEDSSVYALVDRYKGMLKNWDHRNHKDIIFYHLGLLEQKRDSSKSAVMSFKNALLFPKARPKIKSYSYEKLADAYFDSNQFFLASSYYDSVLKIEKEETLRTRKIQRKYNSLAALINYESIVKYNDSVLGLVLLDDTERIEYFQNHINTLKAKDEEKSNRRKRNSTFGESFGNSGGKQSRRNRGKWYFYNPQSLSFGESEFERIWGKRSLEDNWRWSDVKKINNKKNSVVNNRNNKKKEKNKDVKITQVDKKYDIQSYLSKIPTETIIIDSLQNERNAALYELGLIYSEKFERDNMAIDRLELLLKSYPPKRLLLRTYYLLYDLYDKQNESKGVFYKKRIVRKFPTSAYARVINNKTNPSSDKEIEEINQLYNASYRLYKDEVYSDAIPFIEVSLETINNNSPLIPKFELLKAYCIGKTSPKEVYKQALLDVFKKYPNSKEGRKASQIAKRL